MTDATALADPESEISGRDIYENHSALLQTLVHYGYKALFNKALALPILQRYSLFAL